MLTCLYIARVGKRWQNWCCATYPDLFIHYRGTCAMQNWHCPILACSTYIAAGCWKNLLHFVPLLYVYCTSARNWSIIAYFQGLHPCGHGTLHLISGDISLGGCFPQRGRYLWQTTHRCAVCTARSCAEHMYISSSKRNRSILSNWNLVVSNLYELFNDWIMVHIKPKNLN